MEVTMYTEDRSFDRKPGLMRTNMNLDLASMKPKRNISEAIDSNLVKLSSPDLERLLVSNGLVTTPTPTQFFYPKNVTEEQEAYARGFLEALGQLHKTQGEPMISEEETVGSQPPQQLSALNTIEIVPHNTVSSRNMSVILPQQYVYSTTTSLPGSIIASSNLPTIIDNMSVARTNTPPQYTNLSGRQQPLIVRLKEEPQMVPSMSPSPSVQPINMEEQELIKIDRKRARNRIAARKCRQRKLDHIATLEERVKELKGDRDRLQSTARSLKDQVEQLRQQIMRHKEKGCDILI